MGLRGNPVNLLDPTGHFTVTELLVSIAIVAVLVAVLTTPVSCVYHAIIPPDYWDDARNMAQTLHYGLFRVSASNIITDNNMGSSGFEIEYWPDGMYIPEDREIKILQAASTSGPTGAHFDGPKEGKDRFEIQNENTPGGIKPFAYVDAGGPKGFSPYSLVDAPNGHRFFCTDVAVARSKDPKVPDILLGAINFEVRDGTAMGNGWNVGPANNGPYLIPAGDAGLQYTTALQTWRNDAKK